MKFKGEDDAKKYEKKEWIFEDRDDYRERKEASFCRKNIFSLPFFSSILSGYTSERFIRFCVNIAIAERGWNRRRDMRKVKCNFPHRKRTKIAF